MRTVVPGGLSSYGKRRRLTTIIAVLAIALAGLFIYKHYHNRQPKTVSSGADLNAQQLQTIKTNDAAKELGKKDYTEAVISYGGAASTAFAEKDYKQSKQTLEDCINKVPDQYVTWDIYDALANTAAKLNDKSLQKSSLQVAITKASALGSGADPATVTYMQQQLKALK